MQTENDEASKCEEKETTNVSNNADVLANSKTISTRTSSNPAGVRRKRRNMKGCMAEQRREEEKQEQQTTAIVPQPDSTDFVAALVSPGTPFIRRKQLILE